MNVRIIISSKTKKKRKMIRNKLFFGHLKCRLESLLLQLSDENKIINTSKKKKGLSKVQIV